MSIPPLVCSTPPPPEQCDDDRDGEEFDIQYNLSQDEEERHEYTYGTYSDYIYPTSSNIHQDIWSSNISKKTDDKLCSNLLEEKKDNIDDLPKSNNSSVNKVVFEDIVLEDLNLKLEDENVEASLEQNVKFELEPFGIDYDKDSSRQNIEDIDKNESSSELTMTQNFNDATLVNEDVKTSEKNEELLGEENVMQESFDMDSMESIKHTRESNIDVRNETVDSIAPDITEPIDSNISEINQINPNVPELIEPNTTIIDEKDVQGSEFKLEDLSDDDFGEFDDFKCISSENKPPVTITYCDNPWQSEVSKNSEFGDFTATFDVDDSNSCSSGNLDETKSIKNSKVAPLDDGTDDFGDFDAFKSTSKDYSETTSLKEDPSQNVPVLSLYSPDSEIQIIESINSVLSSIFTSEILELESDFVARIETSLNETWGHLVDTDVRQSYIVNWNNSLGQKSLLKALCIDSRNILFGPKWNNSMPKYAANLTVAPLQPQKPVTPTNTRPSDEQNVDRTSNKDTGTWNDPFTSDGQESCNSETESNAAVTRPANLDVFTNAISPEMGHIYSSTLTVQPIRQINLPDTHIFTPTDSETPRSKTIHYDQGPPVLVPQPPEGNRQLDELTSKSLSETPVQNSENDEDYWEFQDFKGSCDTSSKNAPSSINQVMKKSTIANNGSLSKIGYETQILQPIKVEHLTPALNWPDPGEVKETFDDFSEFVSNASWTNENTSTGNQSDTHLNKKSDGGKEELEDDFESFQSAPTSEPNTFGKTANIKHQNLRPHEIPQQFINTSDISQPANSKSEGIISKRSLVQNESSHPCIDNLTTIKDSNEKTSSASSGSQSLSATIMQPSIANTSAPQRNQQKSGQILQPLSLESYSQINWPSPGIDLQDLSRFNPVESLQSLKTDLSTGGSSKLASPAHKDTITTRNDVSDEDIWGDFVSSKPKQQMPPKKVTVFADDDEWTDFVSSPSAKPQNGLNTISLNVHTNSNMQKSLGPNKFHGKSSQLNLDIPTLKYVTPKSSSRGLYNEKHFQNL